MFDKINISKDTWKEIVSILGKYHIPYTTHYEDRNIPGATEDSGLVVTDKHIQINLVIPNYFEER